MGHSALREARPLLIGGIVIGVLAACLYVWRWNIWALVSVLMFEFC